MMVAGVAVFGDTNSMGARKRGAYTVTHSTVSFATNVVVVVAVDRLQGVERRAVIDCAGGEAPLPWISFTEASEERP
jgi:hypothetical protein